MAGIKSLTNKFNLPDTLVKAASVDTHKLAGSISVTTLIDSAQIRYLKATTDYSVDVADNIYALMGTALHKVLELSNIDSVRERAFILTAETIIKKAEEISQSHPEKAEQLMNGANWIFKLVKAFFPETQRRYIFERTLRLEVGKEVISGTFDLYDKETGIIYDYKFCSVYNYIFPEARKKWEEQANVYAYMLRQEGFVVNGLRIVAFFRDWNRHGQMQNRDYPDMQIKEIDLPMYEDTWIKDFIYYRLDQHFGETIPECTGAERWATADEYAIMSINPKGVMSKRAIRKFTTQKLADSFIQENTHNYHQLLVQLRPGESRRCKDYCPVKSNCDQYKAELERLRIANDEK